MDLGKTSGRQIRESEMSMSVSAMNDPTQRFSTRVDDYVRARPGYPEQLIEFLHDLNVVAPRTIADVGSGTGILTALLLKHGYSVYGVEPNQQMRSAAESALAGNPHFHSVDGRAEATTLAEASMDCITAAQAFHWFDRDKTRLEFRRIIKPGGLVFLVWNTRRTGDSVFMQEYENLVQAYSLDNKRVSHDDVSDDVLSEFFGGGVFQKMRIPNTHLYDFARLRSGLLSASYAPQQGHPQHEPMLEDLERLFNAHQRDGRIAYELETNVYYGHV